MINSVMSVITGLLGLGGKLIEDKDKRAEFASKALDIASRNLEVMMNTKTYPWVDALVKLSYASEQIIKGLFTPVVTTIMMGFEIYFILNNVEIPEALHALLGGSFPAWRASRHAEKMKVQNRKLVEAKINAKYQIDIDDDYDG